MENKEEKPDLDRALDAALAKYAAVEPRAGLEDRILANLHAERPQVAERAWWRWAVPVALAATVVVSVALLWKSSKPLPMAFTKQLSAGTQVPVEAKKLPQNAPSAAVAPPPHKALHRVNSVPEVAISDEPKLDQFPSPRPLSDEELALANYVRNFPADATLVARAQEASAQEIVSKMQELANESGESN